MTRAVLAERDIVEILGLGRGSAVRTRHQGKGLLAVHPALFGGEFPDETRMRAESREQASDRMRAQARPSGADGIVAMRLRAVPVKQGAAPMLAYGTALRLRAGRCPVAWLWR